MTNDVYVDGLGYILLTAFKFSIVWCAHAGAGSGSVGVGILKGRLAILGRPHQSINSNYYSKFITVSQINAAGLLS